MLGCIAGSIVTLVDKLIVDRVASSHAKNMTTNRSAAISWLRVVKVLILIVFAIVILRLMIRTPTRGDLKESAILSTKTTLGYIKIAIELYQTDCGSLPAEADGLRALLLHTDAPGWMGPYLTKLVPDSWNTPFSYEVIDGQAIVTSAGPDKIFGTKDDIRVRSRRTPD